MQKYCKILDDKTGLVQIGVGCPDEYYIEIGMEVRDVQQSDIDGEWYLTDKCPMKPIPTKEEEAEQAKQARIAEIKEELEQIDIQAVRPLRAIVSNTATEFDTNKLSTLEAQAAEFRAELAELG